MGSGRDDVQGLSQLCCPKAMNWWPIRYSCLLLCSTVCGERWHIWLVPSSSRFSASTPPWVSLNILSLVPPPSPDPTLPEMPLSDSAVGYPGVNTFAPSPCLLHELRQSIELFWAFILSPVQWRYVRGMLGESKEIPYHCYLPPFPQGNPDSRLYPRGTFSICWVRLGDWVTWMVPNRSGPNHTPWLSGLENY